MKDGKAKRAILERFNEAAARLVAALEELNRLAVQLGPADLDQRETWGVLCEQLIFSPDHAGETLDRLEAIG